MTQKPAKILIIDDNEADRRVMAEAFRTLYPEDQLVMAEDGIQGIEKLYDEINGDFPVDLILLDLSLPKKDGLEVLMEIRKINQFKHVPVVIFTTSQWETDHKTSRLLKADASFVKPFKFAELIDTVKKIRQEFIKS